MSTFFALLFWFATVVIILGLALKIRQYWVTPAPLKIPTTPAPVTKTGVVFRMAREVVIFESLFKSNKWIWIFGWMFHMGLFAELARQDARDRVGGLRIARDAVDRDTVAGDRDLAVMEHRQRVERGV